MARFSLSQIIVVLQSWDQKTKSLHLFCGQSFRFPTLESFVELWCFEMLCKKGPGETAGTRRVKRGHGRGSRVDRVGQSYYESGIGKDRDFSW